MRPTRRATQRTGQLERTREDILDATAAVLEEVGYPGIRVEAICRRAGVSRGAFYHHFPSKEAAVASHLEREAETLVELDRRITELAPGDPARQAALGLATVLRFTERKAQAARAYFIDMLGVPEVQALRDRIELGYEARILSELQPAFRAGALVAATPRAAVQAAMGAGKGIADAWLRGRVPDLDAAIGEVVRFCLMGLGVSPDRARALAEEAAAFRPDL